MSDVDTTEPLPQNEVVVNATEQPQPETTTTIIQVAMAAKKDKTTPMFVVDGVDKNGEPNNKVSINYRLFSNELSKRLSIHNFKKQLYVFDAQCGTYRVNTNLIETSIRDTVIKYEITERLSAITRETMAHLGAMGDTKKYPFIGTFGTINVKNGLLNLETGELRPAHPNDLCDYQIQTEYHEFKETRELDAFLDVYGTREPIAVLAKVIWQRAFHDVVKELTVFYGPKDCGKTTLAEFIQSALDGDTTSQTNTSRTLLNDMLQRFGTAELLGKLMNYGDDLPDLFIKNSSRLNTLVGSVVQKIEQKGIDAFTTTITAYHLFSANNLPPLDDDDNVIWGKIHLVPFEKIITDRKPRDTLFTKDLKEQLLYRSVQMALGFRKTPYINQQNPEYVRSIWHEAGTNVDAFVCDALDFDFSYETTLEDIKKHYEEWSAVNHKKTYYKYLNKILKIAWKHTSRGNVYSYRLIPLRKGWGNLPKAEPISEIQSLVKTEIIRLNSNDTLIQNELIRLNSNDKYEREKAHKTLLRFGFDHQYNGVDYKNGVGYSR